MARNRKNRKAATATATVTAINNTQTITTAYTWNDIDSELNELIASWADEPVQTEPVQEEDFAHLDLATLTTMCQHLGIKCNTRNRQTLIKRLVAAENGNGVLQHTSNFPAVEPTPLPLTIKHDQYVPAENLVDGWDITKLTYRELQQFCKNYGVKARGTRENLEFALLTAVAAGATKCDPKKSTKSKKSKSEPKAKVTEALSYRQAQRLNSWARANLSKYEAPVKNSGWDNVKAIAKYLTTNTHFQGLMTQRKQVELLCAELDCTKEQLRSYLSTVAA